MVTIVLVSLGVALLLAVAVTEVRSWRKPGRHIGLNAPMDDDHVNAAHFTHEANLRNNPPTGPSGF